MQNAPVDTSWGGGGALRRSPPIYAQSIRQCPKALLAVTTSRCHPCLFVRRSGRTLALTRTISQNIVFL
eukprot:1934404-Amphidinium_carterae.1